MAKHYDKQFKEDALQYREDHPELTVTAVCRNLGISVPTFYNWHNQAKQNDGEVDHIGSGNYASEEAREIARLKRELKNKDDALQILKKAWVFWQKTNISSLRMCSRS